MSISSDEFDGDIRGPLYDLQQAFIVLDPPMNKPTEALFKKIQEAIELADDICIDLLDQEDKEEALWMKQHEADDLGDAKYEELREERRS